MNSLAKQGLLTNDEERFRVANNEWYDANFTNPSDIDPMVYDSEVNPGAVAWFKSSAVDLIERAEGYLRILAAHGVVCEGVASLHPGRVVYEDPQQIVVVPAELPEPREMSAQPNERPRQTLDFKTPSQALAKVLR